MERDFGTGRMVDIPNSCKLHEHSALTQTVVACVLSCQRRYVLILITNTNQLSGSSTRELLSKQGATNWRSDGWARADSAVSALVAVVVMVVVGVVVRVFGCSAVARTLSGESSAEEVPKHVADGHQARWTPFRVHAHQPVGRVRRLLVLRSERKETISSMRAERPRIIPLASEAATQRVCVNY